MAALKWLEGTRFVSCYNDASLRCFLHLSSGVIVMLRSLRRRVLACGAVYLGFVLPAMAAVSAFPIPQNSSSASPQTAKEEIPALDPGQAVTFTFSGPGKHTYRFELKQGEYSTILLDCPELSARSKLFDPAGAAVDITRGYDKATKDALEIVAPTSGQYSIDVLATAPKGQEKACMLQLSIPRTATEREAAFQEARSLGYRASMLADQRKTDEALPLIQRDLEMWEKLTGPEDASMVFPLGTCGNIYMAKSDFLKAEEFFQRALAIKEKSNQPANGQTFWLLNNLGTIFVNLDQFGQAETTLQRAIEVATSVFGADAPSAINATVNLANVYDEEGDYIKAQSVFEQALAAGERIAGPDDPGISVIVANISGVCSERGDYLNAIRFGQRAVNIFEKAGRLEDSRLAFALVSLGDAYRFSGELDKAESLYDRALKIYEKKLGGDDPLVADNLAYLADIYRERHEFARAEAFYQRSLSIREKNVGEGNSTVGASLDSLGLLYSDQDDYARAEPLYRRALAIQQKSLGAENPVVAETLTHLSALETAKGDFVQAESFLSQAIAISQHNADLNLIAGSERQKLDYLRLWSSQLDRAITLSSSLAPDQKAARDLAVTTVLQRKGRVQDVLADSLRTLHQRVGPGDARLLDQFDEVTSQVARLVVSGPQHITVEENEKRINTLREQRERLEAEISMRSAQFRAQSQPVTLEAVRAALPANSALIEFVNYQRTLPSKSGEQGVGESRYIAYVIRPSGETQWKELGEAKELVRAIDAYRQALRDPNRNDVNQLARALDEKILQPLRPMLGDATRMLISPDGQLSLIPFEALVDQQNQFAVQRYSISYLSTGRDLLRMQVTLASKSGPLVIADPSFGEPNSTQLARATQPNARNRRRSVTTASDLSSVYFAPLAGTSQEAGSIHLLFPNATVLTGSRATVTALKQAEAPSILHIATHGFFLQDPQRSNSWSATAATPTTGTRSVDANLHVDNPLLRSGLALAGANLGKTGKNSGILTALEASNLNLWGTKLVTLSACDTGVGEVRNGEGVYGLRRSFFLAGSETLVMSLWPVSDYVTREMMVSYYNGLKHGLGRGDALRQAQLAMLKRKDRQHPFYWASFIQSGEWANLDGQR